MQVESVRDGLDQAVSGDKQAESGNAWALSDFWGVLAFAPRTPKVRHKGKKNDDTRDYLCIVVAGALCGS